MSYLRKSFGREAIIAVFEAMSAAEKHVGALVDASYESSRTVGPDTRYAGIGNGLQMSCSWWNVIKAHVWMHR